MIPKVIHYCWFGNGTKPELLLCCLESWKKYCPDYKIIEWNEENYDVHAMTYTSQAYEKKKYAFVSDVARLDVVNRYGGIYLDTDVLLKNNLDALLDYNSFFFFETLNINTGQGFGSTSHNPILEQCIKDYENKSFVDKKGNMDLTPCPAFNTQSMLKVVNFDKFDNNKKQIVNNNAFLSFGIYSNYAKHLYAKTWLTDEAASTLNKVEYREKSKFILNLRKGRFIKFLYNHFKFGYKIYVFLIYDLYDNGINYYVKKVIKKCKR